METLRIDNELKRARESAIRETTHYIDSNWNHPEFAWPTEWTLPPARPEPATMPDSRLDGMTVYVQGVFYLDRSVYIDTALPNFLDALCMKQEKLQFRWAFNGCEVGGFPAQAIRTARAKGATVAVGSILPARLPPEFEQFFEEQRVETSYLHRTASGPVPQTLKFHFADGRHLLIVDRGGGSYAVPLPVTCFDVLLINPGGSDTRRPLLKELETRTRACHGKTTVGLVGRGDWTREDWDLVKDTGIRTYLNEQELIEAMAPMNGAGSCQRTEERLALLRLTVGRPLVTVTLGQRGSLMMNHVPYLTHAAAASVPICNLVGSGDTLMTTATLSAASGASDGRCCLRGNMEAARHIAGRPPAGSLSELDYEIARHPEMTERQLSLPN